jgi:tetratricopeptide (TPR) repeat protein
VAQRLETSQEVAAATYEATARLADSLTEIGRCMKKGERRVTATSMLAYVVFVAVLLGAVLLVYRTRAGAWQDELDRAREAVLDARARASFAEEALGKQQAASRAASEYHQLIERGDHGEVLARAKAVLALELSPTERAVFARAQADALRGVVAALHKEGLDALAKNRAAEAESAFRTALEKDEDGALAAELHLALGRSLAATQKWAEARTEMTIALQQGVEEKVVEARYHLAEVLRQSEEPGLARSEYARFVRAEPRHPLSWKAKHWLSVLAR